MGSATTSLGVPGQPCHFRTPMQQRPCCHQADQQSRSVPRQFARGDEPDRSTSSPNQYTPVGHSARDHA